MNAILFAITLASTLCTASANTFIVEDAIRNITAAHGHFGAIEQLELDFGSFVHTGMTTPFHRKLPELEFDFRDTIKAFRQVQSPDNSIDQFLGMNDDGETIHIYRKTDTTTGEEIVVGSIVSVPDQMVYQIRPDAEGRHLLVARESESFPREEDDDDDEDTNFDKEYDIEEEQERNRLRGGSGGSGGGGGRQRKLQSSVTIDVMVVWTKAAECEHNGGSDGCSNVNAASEASMRAMIDLAFQESNSALQNSGSSTRLRLVHAYRDPNYVESGSANALNHMSSWSDGIMDDLHDKRTQYGADAVAMIFTDPNTCGRARYNYPSVWASRMYSVTSWDCATGYYSFAHEIMHNLGVNHDRGASNACSDTANTNYGFRSKEAQVRSVMAYSCRTNQCDGNPFGSCTRIPRFASDRGFCIPMLHQSHRRSLRPVSRHHRPQGHQPVSQRKLRRGHPLSHLR